MTAFPCTKGCGACCRLVWAQKWFRDNAYLAPDGSCKHLTPDGLCGIYDTRPDFCRIDAIYEKAGLVQIGVPLPAWHDHVIRSTCEYAITQTGGNPAHVPAKSFDYAEMLHKVDDYLNGLGGGAITMGRIVSNQGIMFKGSR
jgi:hypothetical protein